MTNHDLEHDLCGIFQVVFAAQEVNCIQQANSSSLEKWDSLGHINLVLAIEQQFNIKFSMDEIAEMVSFEKVKEMVELKIKEK